MYVQMSLELSGNVVDGRIFSLGFSEGWMAKEALAGLSVSSGAGPYP